MLKLIEIAKERGAKIMDIFDVANPQNITGILLNEKILQATFDDYCKQFEPVIIEAPDYHRRNCDCGNCFKPANTTTIPAAEYEQLKADARRWRFFIETCSCEAGFELTGIDDASNEQIIEAIDQARSKE